MQDNVRKLNQELNQKKIENASLLKKIAEFDKLMKIQSTNMSLEFSPEIVTLVKELKTQVTQIEDFHKKKNQENNFNQKVLLIFFFFFGGKILRIFIKKKNSRK